MSQIHYPPLLHAACWVGGVQAPAACLTHRQAAFTSAHRICLSIEAALADYLTRRHAQFHRERIPERVVHARGMAAKGVFEVTHDVTDLTYADFLSEVGFIAACSQACARGGIICGTALWNFTHRA